MRGRGSVHPVRAGPKPTAWRAATRARRSRSAIRRSASTTAPSDPRIDELVKDRLMLCEDADDAQARLLAAGLAAGVPVAKGNLPPQTTPPLCHEPEPLERESPFSALLPPPYAAMAGADVLLARRGNDAEAYTEKTRQLTFRWRRRRACCRRDLRRAAQRRRWAAGDGWRYGSMSGPLPRRAPHTARTTTDCSSNV